jgi:hypothetical protein
MIGLLCFVLAILALPFKSKLRLEAENAMLRHQLTVLRRGLHGCVRLTNHDRWFFIQLYRWFPSILKGSQSSDPRRSCVGIGPAFAATGVGVITTTPELKFLVHTVGGVGHSSVSTPGKLRPH